MPLSPVCLVSDNSGPFVPTTNGVNVGPGDNIQIMLQSPSGVGTWYLIIYGTDELTTSPPALTNVNPATGQVISPTSIVSFTYPGTPAGRSIVFQSTVVSGSNTAQTTFAIYSLTPNGDRVGAVGETREGNVNYGWAALLNPILRLGAAYLYYNDGITNPPTGASTIQGAIDYLKTHAGGGGGPDIGAIHPQSFSSAGPGGSTYSPIGYETGSIVGVGGGSFETAIYDANTTINGGPFIWGISGGSIFRYNTDASQPPDYPNESFVMVPLSDFFVIAEPSDLTQDSSFNIWAIESASQTLVKIQEDPPKILASYPIPGTPKYFIAYDAANNELILSNYETTIAKCSTAGVFSSDITPPGLVANEAITGIYVFGGFLFITGTNTTGLSGYVHRYTLPSVALVGTATISPMNTPTSVYPTAATYIQNGSSPKLFVSVSVSPGPVAGTPIYRIDVTTMTVDTYVSISGASSELLSLAIDPVASPPSLWVADDDTRPSVVYVIADILVTFTYSTTYPVDPATNSVSLSIFWDTYGGTYFWVVCTGSVSSISQLLPSGTVRSTTQFADTTYIVRPGNSGYVLTSQGPGLVPTWTAPSSGGAASTFVYRPGGTPESNVFTTFEAAVTAANALFGAATTIYVDATFGTPQVVGTGLDLTNITLIGYIQNGSSGPATLTFQTGSSIVNVWAALVNITVVGANVMSVSPETQLYLQGSYATIQGTGGNAFFNAPAPFGQPISIELAGTAFVVGDGENPVFNLVFAYSGIYLIEIGADVQPQNNFVSGSFENVYIFVSASAGIEELEVGVQYLGFVVYPPTLIGYIVGYAPDNTPITVDATHCDAQVDPSAGPVTVNISGYAYTGMPVRVTDISGFAATNNITVTAESIENPYSIGSFSSSVTLNTNSAAVVWYLDLAGNFKVLSASLPASGGFTDNASAARTHNEPGLRRNEFNTGGGEGGENVIDLEGTYGINWPLIDGPGVAGNGIAILSDKFFFVGHDSEGARGALYGIDLFNYEPVSIGYLRNYEDAPTDLIGIRGMANDLETADWLFGIFPDSGFIELGTISGLPQNMTYTTYYNTSLAEGVVPIRACFGQYGGGGYDGINVPIFFYSGSDGNIYLTTTTGAINTWFSTGDQPGALFVDDLGNLWVLYMESNTLVRLTPPEVGPATISLSIPMPPGTNYVIDMVSDGRFARVLAIYGDRVTIFAFDLQSGAQGPTLALDYIDSLGDYPHIAWDGVSLYVSTGTYAADTPQLYRINAMTNEVLFATAFGANNGRTSTRGIVVQDSGTVILATYDSEANLNFGLAAGNFPNANFNSIGILGRPLTFLNGGQLQNIIEVNAFSSGTFDAYHNFAACDTSTGACSVTMFVPLDFPNQYTFAGRWMVGVWDFSGNALTNNITVYASEGIPIEDPSAPGTYLDTVVLAQNGVSAVWVLDYVMSVWKLYSYAGPLPLAGTEGALLYYTGGAWTPLPAGSSGEVLAMGVSDPEWVSPSAIGAGWQTVLDLDFTAQSSQSLGTDGDHTIAGLTFVKANSANDASPMVLTSGTGIVITPVSNTNYFASTDSMPELRLSLVQIIPDIQFGTPIRLWLYISSANYTAEYDDVVLALEGPGNINASYTFKRGWNTNNANGYLTAYNYDGSSVGQTSDQNTNATDNVIIVTAEAGYPNPQFSSQSGAYSSGWPSPSIVNAHVGINASGFGITPAGTPQNVGLVFGAHRAGSSTNFVATIARLRVDYRI